MASVKKNFIYDLINNVTGLLFPLITFPYISRILSPEGIGEVAFSQSLISYFVMFAALGIPTYALREVARLRNKQKELSQFTFEIFVIHASLSVIVYIVAISLYFVDRINDIWFLYLIASTHIILNFIGFSWFFQGVENFKFITIRVLIFRLLSLLLLFTLVRERSDVYWYMAILIFAEAGNNICNLFALKKYISFKGINFADINIKKHIKPIVNLFLLSISTMIYFNMDILMIGFINNDLAVGYYTPSLRIQRMLMGFVLSLSTVLFPRLSNLALTDKNKFVSLSREGFNVTLGISIPIVFGIFALGKPLILIFAGEQFYPSILTLYLLSPVIILGTSSNLLAKILISQEKEKIVLLATSAGALTNLLFNAILIYYYSQYGAAIASSLSEFVVLIAMIVVGNSFLPKPLIVMDVLKYVIASCIMFVIVYVFNISFNTTNLLIKCVLSFFIGIIAYTSLLIIMKEKILVQKFLHIVTSKKIKN